MSESKYVEILLTQNDDGETRTFVVPTSTAHEGYLILKTVFENAIKVCQTPQIKRIWLIALKAVNDCPTVDAVEVPDKKLLKAINLLIKQYEHSRNSDYVHSPVAHAFYHTWKQLDDGRRE